MRGPPLGTLTLLTALVLPSGACGPGDADLVVLVASSLSDAAEEFAAPFGAAVSEGGSQVIAAQVESGAPADVVLLADPDIAARLHASGLADEPVALVAGGLAVVVAARARDRIDDAADLADPDLRVVLADEGVPLGAYTREGLRRLEDAGLVPAGTAAAVLAGADSLEESARTVLAKVIAEEADAAIVYRSDLVAARRADRDVTGLVWPEAADVRAVYTAQIVAASEHRAEAEAFVAALRAPSASETWRDFGFDPEPES
ncbi:MAG: molybdate ABC transporter substrate-binding protein [Nitriliruptorales bacterium]